MTEVKIEVGKKYILSEGGRDFVFEILHIYSEKLAFGRCDGEYTAIFNAVDTDWQEYQEPDIFDGFEVGDMVKIETIDKEVWLGFIIDIGEYMIYTYFEEGGKHKDGIDIPKNEIKSIVKLYQR